MEQIRQKNFDLEAELALSQKRVQVLNQRVLDLEAKLDS
jgi:uncharacterized protein YlxW (UPF0749 family)